ncbi:MAG: hypothetical protein NTV61_07040 [Candidatus Bathyarchaeota archaeon]|nr:hypothetical protein [Candidatus Bathyarchaeota archaeon]
MTTREDFWYPNWEIYIVAHERVLDQWGGYPGFVRYAEQIFDTIIDEVKGVDGLYEQAGLLLYRLRVIRLVHDAQKRTAFAVTEVFLEKNGGRIFEKDPSKVNRFMKDMLKFTPPQVVEWIRFGAIPEEAQGDTGGYS